MLSLLSATSILVGAHTCPGLHQGTPPASHVPVPSDSEYEAAVKTLDIKSVFSDIGDLLVTSDECWPADVFPDAPKGNYGPLFIRLAWHAAGTYRISDHVGGVGGGRQRFEPEASWDDNVNLDKARALLWPIKQKYGIALSWGDLFTFAGTAAIHYMNGPVSEVCAGRPDDSSGEKSKPLGPGPEAPPCPVSGNCPPPLGTQQIGLIYVNPEGFMGNPHDLVGTATAIRDVFSRMGMDDKETVALIGGGHAFGKAHGACPDGPGLPPNEDINNPWPGNCGTGKGKDTFTSGLEGAWTSTPATWGNEFFRRLRKERWEVVKGPGGANQFHAPTVKNSFMLATDIALIHHPFLEKYVDEFAASQASLDDAFSKAWEKLMTHGGRWLGKHCVKGSDLPRPVANTSSEGLAEAAASLVIKDIEEM